VKGRRRREGELGKRTSDLRVNVRSTARQGEEEKSGARAAQSHSRGKKCEIGGGGEINNNVRRGGREKRKITPNMQNTALQS